MQATKSWNTVLGVMATAFFLMGCIAIMTTEQTAGAAADKVTQGWLLHDEAREVRLV